MTEDDGKLQRIDQSAAVAVQDPQRFDLFGRGPDPLQALMQHVGALHDLLIAEIPDHLVDLGDASVPPTRTL
ncbi:MAG: hypothetical protein MZV49_08000 [Rhodopseudomonas palustris]|nr:hypothetical protein [Rhodopseudomonas palustris]